MKVMVIGANGQLGSDLITVLRESHKEVVGLSHQEIEVLDKESIAQNLNIYRPDIVINTAAYHKVDVVESNPVGAFAVNAIAPACIAAECAQRDIAVMFLSTDYIFGADRERSTAYLETDVPGPINVYGTSKLAGEMMVRYTCPKHYIVRTSGLYGLRGASGKGGNFVETMLKLAREGKAVRVVNDQRLTPTYTVDLAHSINDLIERGNYGLYHVTNEGDCSWYEFALKIFELSNLKPDIKPVQSSEFKTAAARPGYSVLSKQRLLSTGGATMRHWREALSDYLHCRAVFFNS